MEDFTFNSFMKLDMGEIGKIEELPDKQNLPIMQIRRAIAISDVMKYLEEIRADIGSGLLHIADLKARMVLRDAKLFELAGYENVYIRDLAPGDTQIFYIMSSVDYTPANMEDRRK